MEQSCKDGNHDLIVIDSKTHDGMSIEVIRWCPNCGAIVIDKESDGRLNPGAIMKMRFPKLVLVDMNK